MYTVWFLNSVDDHGILIRDTFFCEESSRFHRVQVDSFTRNYFRNRSCSASRTGKVVPIVVQEYSNTLKIIWFLQCFDKYDTFKSFRFTLNDCESGNSIYPTN